jgi:surface protein
VGTESGSCFIISSNSVVLDGAGFSATTTEGNSSYAIWAQNVATTTNTGVARSGYSNLTIRNITFVNFGGGGIDASGKAGTDNFTPGGNGGSITIATSTMGAVKSTGESGFNQAAGTGGAITVSNSTVGTITVNAGSSIGNPSPGGAGSITVSANSTTGNLIANGGNATGSDIRPTNGGAITVTSSTVSGTITSNGGNNQATNSYTLTTNRGGNITITSSTVTGTITSTGSYNTATNYGVTGGPGGTISITSSTVATTTSQGGVGSNKTSSGTAGNGGPAGAISLTNSTSTGLVSALPGAAGVGSGGGTSGAIGAGATTTIATSTTKSITNRGTGGAIVITGTNLDLSNNTYNATSTFSLTYSGTLNKTNALVYTAQFISNGTNLGALSGAIVYPFVSTWDTTLISTGSSNNNQVKLPLYSGGTYNFVVNWGDNSSSTITSWNQAETTHTYSSTGTYTISISGTLTGWSFANTGDRLKIKTITQWGILNLGNAGTGYFYGTTNLKITATDILNMTGTTNMASAFRSSGIDTVPSMNSWDMSNVTNMNYMFNSATAFNQNIGSWNTASTTNMGRMFMSASAFNQNIGSWNTEKVTDMNYMFNSATAFNQNIGSWNTAKVTTMQAMFQSATAFNQDIGGWNTTKVTDMNNMFFGASIFNNGGSNTMNNWVTSNVTNMSGMFRSATAFNQNIGSWNTASTTDMNRLFNGASAFNQNIGSWNTAKVTTMQAMFQSATAFNQNIGSWNTASTTNMSSMFQSATAFNQNIGSWNTGKVTSMSYMFNAANAFNQNIGSWDVSKVTGMTGIFNNAIVFNQNLANWNVTGVTAAGATGFMFSGSGLSATNYSNILVGWSAQAVQTGITLSTGPKYYTGIPETARAVLTDTYGWIITDGGTQDPAVFNDTTNGNWSAGATWGNLSNVEGVGYPGPYDTAVINSNTVTLPSSQSVATTTLSSTGILNLAGNNFTSPSFTSSGTLQLQGGETVSTPTLSVSSTVEYTATSSTRDIKNWDYTNATLKINGSGGTFTLPTNIVVAGINILAGILDSNTFNITNSGNWANSSGVSGFTAGSGTVTFNGANTTVTGATNFYRTNGSGSILAFPALSTILENNTAVTTNNGIIAINNSTIATNGSTGLVNTNNSTIATNNGTTTTNTVSGTITSNNGTITTNNGEVPTNAGGGTITTNNGTVSSNAFGGSITNNLGSIILNNGTADTATFSDGQFNGPTGHITGSAIFNYSGFVVEEGAVVDITGYANGIVDGLTKDSLGNTILTWVFNTTDNLGHVTGDAMFNGTSTNTGTVDGNVIFNGSSTNSGTIMHNVDIYAPVPRPLGGTVYGLKTYHGYDGMYFNDKDGSDGNWNNANNWWKDSAFTIPALDFPGAGDEVHIYSDIATTTTPATASSVTFERGARNHISINISGDVTFFATSTNDTEGSINSSSTVTFMQDLTDNLGTVTGTLIRKFTQAVTTTRNFVTEGGRNDWIIIAQGVAVNISNAIYNTAVNIFKALSGGSFTTGSNPAVTPIIVSSLPTPNETVIKWLPSVDWGTATSTGFGSCEYSYDNWTTANTANCASNGTDIARPDVGAKILSLRGTDALGNITEQNIPFTYDNVSPVWTSCGTDYLDESTREYYYLQDGAVTGDCHLKVSAELRGSLTGIGTLTGNVISDATSTNAFDITLKNIVVVGTTTAETSAEGKDGGNIIVENSIVGALISDGALGTVGGKAGDITVSTSTTGTIVANGGSGSSQGSNGGTITVWNSDGVLAGTLVEAVGGNATVCGPGGEGGDIQILNSNNYVAVSDSGADQIEAGAGKCAVPGTPSSHIKKTPVVVARPVPTSASTNTNTNTNGGNAIRKAFVQNTINQITLPVQMLKPVKLTKLPTFGEDKKGSFSFLTQIKNFLFSTTNSSTLNNLKKYPKLQKYLTDTLNLNTDQKLVSLYKKPLKLDANAGDVLGIFKVISPKNNVLVTTLKVDKKGNLSQYIKVNTKDNYQTLNLSLATTSQTAISGILSSVIPAKAGIQSENANLSHEYFSAEKSLDPDSTRQSPSLNLGPDPSSTPLSTARMTDGKYTFTNNPKNITTTINIPQKAGTYTFTTSASPLPLIIEVVQTANTQAPVSETGKSLWGKVKSFFRM